MIFFLSDGRLGNQLFQYSFLNTIARNNERIIVTNMNQFVDYFDINNSNFINVKFHKYIFYFIRGFFKIYILMPLVKARLIGYVSQNITNGIALPTFKERHGLLPVRLVETHFFQSEKMFECSKVNFTIKKKYKNKALEIFSKFPKDLPIVFVHIRRGDYINISYNGFRGINLPKSYYMNALNRLINLVGDIYCVFLTDDYDFVETCFAEIDNKYISSEDAITDLVLMTMCDFGITSNSSFSWWGAYLMKNRQQVIFPKYWYGWKSKIDSHINIQPNWGTIIDVD